MSKLLDHNQYEFDTARIRNYFVLIFILGSICIFLGLLFKGVTSLIVTIVIPVLLMGIYLYIGLSRSTLASVSVQFADSCYYLGFLFTLIALSASLWDFRKSSWGLDFQPGMRSILFAATRKGVFLALSISMIS